MIYWTFRIYLQFNLKKSVLCGFVFVCHYESTDKNTYKYNGCAFAGCTSAIFPFNCKVLCVKLKLENKLRKLKQLLWILIQDVNFNEKPVLNSGLYLKNNVINK